MFEKFGRNNSNMKICVAELELDKELDSGSKSIERVWTGGENG